MDWKVTNALNRDVERQHLNAILKDIKAKIDSLTTTNTTNTNTVTQIINGTTTTGGSSSDTGINAFMLTLAGGVSGSANIDGSDVTLDTTLNTDGLVEEAPEDNQFYWRWNGTWQPVPEVIQNFFDASGEGILVQYQKPSHETDFVTRSIEVVSGELTVTDGDGVSGNPTLGLADLTDTGVGVSPIKLITRDGKGRVEGTQDADTDDLPEGTTNLYFSDERVDDRVSNLLVAGTNITLTYDDLANTLTIDSAGGVTNLDGGTASSVYGGTTAIDGGGA